MYLKSLLCFVAIFLCSLLNAMSGEFSGEVAFGKRVREEERSFQTSKAPRLVLALPPLTRNVSDRPTTHSYIRARELGQRAQAASMRRNIVARIQSNTLTLRFSQINESTLARLAETRQLFTIGELNIQPSQRRARIVPAILDAHHIRLIARYFPALTSITTDINIFMSRGAFEELAKSALAPMLIKLKIHFTENTYHDHVLDRSTLIKLFSNFKSLQELSITCRDDEELKALWLSALAESKTARTIRALDIGEDSIEVESFTRELLDRFESLEELRLWSNFIGDSGFGALAQSSVAQRLRVLDVGQANITARSFTLENLNNFRRLEELYISSNGELGDTGFRALAASIVAPNLIVLDIAHNEVTQAGFELKFLNNFKRLRDLNAWANEIGNEGFEALSLSAIAQTVHRLNVGNTSIAGPRLSSHQFNRFTRLKILSIAHNACYNVLKEIAESTLAKNLQMLDVSRNFITEEFIDPRHLVRFINLQELNLSFNPLKDLGFVLLAKSGLAARLRILKLSNTLLTDAVFVPEFLDAFINLKELYVAGNYITAKGLINLAHSKLVLRLNVLDIDANAIQATVLNLFKADFPQIKLVRLH